LRYFGHTLAAGDIPQHDSDVRGIPALEGIVKEFDDICGLTNVRAASNGVPASFVIALLRCPASKKALLFQKSPCLRDGFVQFPRVVDRALLSALVAAAQQA